MRHHKIQKMLSLFADDRLSSTEADFIRDHLNTCDDCRRLLQTFNVLSRTTHETPVKVNPFFASRVLNDFSSRQREVFWNVFDILPRPVVVTGLTLAVITLAVFAMPFSPVRQPNTSEYALLYGEQSDVLAVTDDQALAIAISATTISNGE